MVNPSSSSGPAVAHDPDLDSNKGDEIAIGKLTLKKFNGDEKQFENWKFQLRSILLNKKMTSHITPLKDGDGKILKDANGKPRYPVI